MTEVLAGTETFLRNMQALWHVDPVMASRIDDVPDSQLPRLEPTRSGALAASFAAPVDGGPSRPPAYLCSRYDPPAEAAKSMAEHARGDTLIYFVMGMGAGYHLKYLLDQVPVKAFFFVFEPWPQVLAAALHCVDLSEAIEAGRLHLFLEGDKTRLHQLLLPRQSAVAAGVRFVTHAASQPLGPAGFYANILSLLNEFLRFARISISTLLSNAQITCHNIAFNLPTYVSTPGIDELRYKFSGFPAIVVAAGPSLRKNFDLLADAKGRAVLCAVQTVLGPMLGKGVEPDFVTSLDFHEMSRRYFENVGDVSGIHLVAEPKATWHVVDHFRGPTSLIHSSFAELLLGPQLARRASLKAGATVAHLSFYLARFLGCDPIIFVGQDLAFSDHLFYLPGVEIHQTWRGELNRFNTLEMKEFDRILRNRLVLRRVRGADGVDLFTDDLLSTYREQFEADFEQSTARIIDATEGGAVKRGTESMTLAEALNRFATHIIPESTWSYRKSTKWRDAFKLSEARREVASRLEEVATLMNVCTEMLPLLDELANLVEQPEAFNRKLVRVDELRTVVRRCDRAYAIINSGCQLAELQRYHSDLRSSGSKVEGSERARRQLRRDRESVKALAEGAKWTTDLLQKTLDRFDRAIEAATDPNEGRPSS